MLFPIGDDDRKLSKPAYVSIALIVINLVVFFFFQGMSTENAVTYGYSTIPAEISTGEDLVQTQVIQHEGESYRMPQAPGPVPIYLTLITSMFMHGGFMHLFGNLLYLWIFGDNVEHRFGGRVFLLLYVISGVVAALVQVMLEPGSLIPTLGASGAISGVLGAYLVLFPRNKVHALLFWFVVSVPAMVAIGLWIAFQLVQGYFDYMGPATLGGVAYGAHIGGFVTGVLLALILRRIVKEEPSTVFTRATLSDGSRQYW